MVVNVSDTLSTSCKRSCVGCEFDFSHSVLNFLRVVVIASCAGSPSASCEVIAGGQPPLKTNGNGERVSLISSFLVGAVLVRADRRVSRA